MSDDANDAAEAKRVERRRRDAAGARRRRADRRIALDDARAAEAEAALNDDSDASRLNSVGNSVAGNAGNVGGDVAQGEYLPPVRHSTLLDLQIRRAAKACALVEADRTIPLIEKARVHISAIGALARGVEKQEHTERLLAIEKRLDARDRRR